FLIHSLIAIRVPRDADSTCEKPPRSITRNITLRYRGEQDVESGRPDQRLARQSLHVCENDSITSPGVRFFTLYEMLRPAALVSRCFETSPSEPNSQALRNRSGPFSPCSKSLTKMPSGRRANSRARLLLS